MLGRVKWVADKRELTTDVPSYPRTSYSAQAPHSDIRRGFTAVAKVVGGMEVWNKKERADGRR
jgi:thiosulfate/3-mercaptopyruvate sulfurtransferase